MTNKIIAYAFTSNHYAHRKLFVFLLLDILEWITISLYVFGVLSKFLELSIKQYVIYKSYKPLIEFFNRYINVFTSLSSIAIAVCLAIIPIILSMDSDSLFNAMNTESRRAFIWSLSRVFLFSLIFLISPLLKDINYYMSMSLILYFILLFIGFLKIYVYFSVILNLGISYRHKKIEADNNRQEYVLRRIQYIYKVVKTHNKI